MQIRAGRLKGRRLLYPRAGLRPTKDITRQAIFNIVGTAIRGARVADLYAGGGSLGVEALSRGATEVVFVEQSAAVARFLRGNVKGLEGVRVVCADVRAALRRLGADRFDVVIADPPYRNGLVQETIARLVATGSIVPGGLLVIEHHPLEPPECPEDWTVLREGRYGDSRLTVLRRNSG
ncbi:MAG: 16S rRNA (guanine(966)-N(2))-methyltransferase RsmD [bacterium]